MMQENLNLFDLSKHTENNGADKFSTDFQTPVNVCRYMASLIPELSGGSILEPTPGIGNLVNAIKEFRPNNTIVSPEDFFLLKKAAV